MVLKTSAFEAGGMIPKKYTCDGSDVSPPLSWSEVPAGAKSLALIADDPDAPMGTWVHWVAWNITPSARPRGRSAEEGLASERDEARDDGFSQHWLRRPLPAIRDSPLLLQVVRARHRPEPAVEHDQEGSGESDAGTHRATGRAHGPVRPEVGERPGQKSSVKKAGGE